MRPDFLPGDGSLAAIRAEHEANLARYPLVNPYTLARVGALLTEYDRRTAELLAANNRELERRRAAEDALQAVLDRITGTVAEAWVMPDSGTLGDFIRSVLKAGR